VNEDQMREIAREGGKEGGREAAHEVLQALGVDIENALEAQKDMHFCVICAKEHQASKAR
jgi:4'-phosphopantetheinyl transferase EntD